MMKNACHQAASRLKELLSANPISSEDYQLIIQLQATGDRIQAFVSEQVHEDILEDNQRRNVIALEDRR